MSPDFVRAFRRSFAVLTSIAAFVAIFQSTGYAYRIVVDPSDSLRFVADSGQSVSHIVWISDGRDSTKYPHGPNSHVHVTLSGSSDFQIISDTSSTITFYGSVVVWIQFTATHSTKSYATLTIAGDSNTVTVRLIGGPLDQRPFVIYAPAWFDTLRSDRVICRSVEIVNPNKFSLNATNIFLWPTDDYFSLKNVPQVPISVPAGGSLTFDLCATGIPGVQTILGSHIQVNDDGPFGIDSVWSDVGGKSYIVPDSICMSYVGGLYPGLLEGDSVNVAYKVTNMTGSPIRLDSAKIVQPDLPGAQRLDSVAFPWTIQGGASAMIYMECHAPKVADQRIYHAPIEVWASGQSSGNLPCEPLLIQGGFLVTYPIVDTIELDAPPGSDTVHISIDQARSLHALRIKNVGTDTIALHSVSIVDPNNVAFFAVNNSSVDQLYSTLAPNGIELPSLVEMDVTDTGTYPISFLLDYDKVQALHEYTVVVHSTVKPLAAVRSQPEQHTLNFSIYPNPASSDVTISLPNNERGTIEIYDVLGNLLAREQGVGQYVWSGRSMSDGTYIVRATAQRTDGTMAVSSQRLMVRR